MQFVRDLPSCGVKISNRAHNQLTLKAVFLNLLRRSHFRGCIQKADIAQLVEQRIRNAKVVGSTPIIGTSNHAGSRDIHQFSKSSLCHICAIPRQE